MKRTLKQSLLALGLLLMASAMVARENRGPLPLMFDLWNPLRYPIEYHDVVENEDNSWCHNWHFDAAAVAYNRSAPDAYQCCPKNSSGAPTTCNCNKNTHHQVPWSTLIFGQTDFTLAQAFPGSNVGTYVATNPFVAFSTLSPRFEYSESGAIFMAQVGTTFSCCGDYRVGVRLRLPVRSLLVFDPCGASDLTGATLDDVWQTRKESIDKNSAPSAMTNTVFAGRLDFLSALVSSVSFPYQGNPLVVYETATNPTTEMAGNAVDVTPVTNNQPIVEVIASSTGAIPTTERWGDYPANGTVPLAGDGSGVMSGSRGRFVHGTDYTSLSASTLAQSQLFVVPSVDSGTNEVVSGANQIMGAVQAAIPNLQSISDFYQQVGLNFCKSHRTGVGDLDFEFYAGRNWGCRGKWWTDVIFGIRCPTAKQTSCSTCTPSCYPVWMPTGNDKHLELRLGGAFGVDVRDWVKLFAHGSWSWALAHNERIATPFQGATVKNLGPCMNAKVKWGYWEGDVDASFFANDCCGLDVGYQLYYKSRDKIRLCTTTATDWAGRTGQALDVNVITRNTKQMGHKAKAGFFAIINDCEIDGGWSTTVGGYNMPRETDFYVRFGVSF